MAIEWRIIELHIYGDSQLIINHINENYLTKNNKLVPYKKMVGSLRCYFTFVSFYKIPRVENKETNVMAILSSLLQLEQCESRSEFLVKELHHPIYDFQESHIIYILFGHDSSHYGAIYLYLHDGIIPDTFNQSKHRNLIQNVSHHSLISGDLYRRSLDGKLIRFLEKEEFNQALVDIHEGIYGEIQMAFPWLDCSLG